MSTTTLPAPTTLETSFLEAFHKADGQEKNGTDTALAHARRHAADHLASTGLPVEKSEAWKYTNIRRALDEFAGVDPLAASTAQMTMPEVESLRVPGLDAFRAVVVNGLFREDLSELAGLPPGLTVCSIDTAARNHADVFERSFGQARPDGSDGMVALNTAFVFDGLFVHATAGTVVERPLEVLFVITGDGPIFVQPRLLCVMDERAELRIVESWHRIGSGRAFTNTVAEWLVAEGAVTDHVRIVDEPETSVHVHYLQVRQTGAGRFSTSTITLGGGIVRNDAYFLPDAEYCETFLNGFYIGRGKSHIDNHTLVDHARPNCDSNELYKGILDDRSTGVFNGKVLVREDSQKTNAYQSNKSVVLTDTARMFSKPELEIYADDVKCSHGATTGELDEDALFYLRSRGIRPEAARGILLQAFAGDVISRVREPAVREFVTTRLSELLRD